MLLPLHSQTLQRVSMAERKQWLPSNVVRASSSAEYDSGGEGRRSIVDANMSLLRRRINQLKLQEEERYGGREPPEEEYLESKWMQWEKKLYPAYHSKVCEMMGLLQSYLMNTRPSVALASLSFTVLIVAASVISVLVTSVNTINLTQFGF